MKTTKRYKSSGALAAIVVPTLLLTVVAGAPTRAQNAADTAAARESKFVPVLPVLERAAQMRQRVAAVLPTARGEQRIQLQQALRALNGMFATLGLRPAAAATPVRLPGPEQVAQDIRVLQNAPLGSGNTALSLAQRAEAVQQYTAAAALLQTALPASIVPDRVPAALRRARTATVPSVGPESATDPESPDAAPENDPANRSLGATADVPLPAPQTIPITNGTRYYSDPANLRPVIPVTSSVQLINQPYGGTGGAIVFSPNNFPQPFGPFGAFGQNGFSVLGSPSVSGYTLPGGFYSLGF